MRSFALQGITGESLPACSFRLPEFETDVPKAISTVLNGQLLGFKVRKFASESDCERIAANFENSPFVTQRSDGVPGRTVGLSLFGKSLVDYFSKVSLSQIQVNSLFNGCSYIPARWEAAFREQLPKLVTLRPAQYEDRQFLTLRANEWTGTGEMALQYHEDDSQLAITEQQCLETSRVSLPVAINLYCDVPASGGQLLLANIIPDRQSKRKLGVERTGYPYPSHLLHTIAKIEVEISKGDLIVFNGKFLHGVRRLRGEGRRLVLNQFLGRVDNYNIVTWC